MRKLSMKGKRGGKSETSSDGDSEENGVGVNAGGNDASAESEVSKTRKKTPRKSGRSGAENNKQPEPSDDNKKEEENGSPAKRRKKNEQKASTSEGEPLDEEYEVLKVVGQRTIKGRRQFLVRWKGYDEDSDTWEQEKNLNCPQLIEEYLTELAESSNNEKPTKTTTPKAAKERKETPKSKTSRGRNKKKAAADAEAEISEKGGADAEDAEETKEFEVEKILEVHFQKKNNKREFLIRWKGFSSAEDTWEPEENLNCPDLIAKFMDKVDNAKKTELKELRTNPAHTKRYTLMSTEHGRRLSRRNMNKQRATYHQCDE